jgi:two-component system chemotaxis response regulator CheB
MPVAVACVGVYLTSVGKRDIVVIGSSAGGVEALTCLMAGLPRDLAAAIFVVQHVPAQYHSILPQLLTRAGHLPASHAEDGHAYKRGHVYVAPPDHHLLIEDGRMRVERGPRENGHRPAVDALFRTAARARGRSVIGVVLTGALDDGAAGLFAVKQREGYAVVQDPDEAYCPDMPRAAMEHTKVDAVVPLDEIARRLPEWTSVTVSDEEVVPHPVMEAEAWIALHGSTAKVRSPGNPSAYVCPDCGGVLNEIEEGSMLRFRCQVGHAFNLQSLQGAQAGKLEAALWAALRSLEQEAELARRLSHKATQINHAKSAAWHAERADAAEKQADLVRAALHLRPRKPR